MFTTIIPTSKLDSKSPLQWNPGAIEASERFERARRKAGFRLLWRGLTHGNAQLEDLDIAGHRCKVTNRYHAGTQKVEIRRIRGSESRSRDFDVDFNPISNRVARRWQSVFQAFRDGVGLPPVELVQVGSQYYVRDGHHRISVASALGQIYVDAVVTVWQTENCNYDAKGK